jgi:hypothetical protein
LLNNINTTYNKNNTTINLDSKKNTDKNPIKKTNDLLKWNYNKVRDNSEWPCEKFFCINIDFIMYEHSLFWWWENITIEYLLNRSNKHLSKYAATSLIQSKMSTNNFELWLKDLNLPDIFHIWFQISTKPVPLLNIEKQSKRDETEYASKNMLERYYKANWLNYKRRNSLVLLKQIEQNKHNILNASKSSIQNATSKDRELYTKYLTEEKKDILLFNKAIEKKVSYWVMQTFEAQYTELNKFTVWINNYVNNIYSIIKAMNKIPKW